MRSEGSYSYTGNKGQVPNFEFHRRARSKGVTVSEDVTVNSIVGLMTTLSQQPCSVAIEDDSLSFQLYTGDVLQFWCGTNLDHDGLPSVVWLKWLCRFPMAVLPRFARWDNGRDDCSSGASSNLVAAGCGVHAPAFVVTASLALAVEYLI